MAIAAIASIFLMAACGSGGTPATPNPVGFNNGSLNGTYVFSTAGSDANGYFLTLAGALEADGNGGITGGTMDVIDPNVAPASPVAQSITSGSYHVSIDGRGQAKLTSSVGTFALDFVLTSSSHGLVTEFDGNGTGSGTIDLQTAVTSLGQLAGSYAFSFAGSDSGGGPFAAVGAFTLNSSGATTAGVEDFNASGIPYGNEPLTGTVTLGSGTGPGTITLQTPAFSALTFDFYPIDSTHLKVIETDYAEFLAGDVFVQPNTSIPSGSMVFTMAGGTESSGPIAVGGLMTSDGTGNFPSGLEDINNAGNISPEPVPFSGSAAGPAGVGGRVIVNLSGFSPSIQWVIYPSSGGLLMLEMDTANITGGVGYAQTATSFTAPASYGLNLSGANGANGGGEVDDIAQFNATTAAAPAVNMTGILDENDMGILVPGASLNPGTYTPDSPATGRGSIIATTNGTYLGGLTLEYYAVNSSTVLFIETDQSQVAAGTFEQQSAPGGGGAARPRISLVHPVVRPHGALRRK
jgi:hypothetical protein